MTETSSRVAEEIGADQRKAQREIHEDAALLAELIRHPGWTRYRALIEAVAQNYHKTAMEPIGNVFEVTKGEFAKGALMGLTLAAALPSAKIQEAAEFKHERSSAEDTELEDE